MLVKILFDNSTLALDLFCRPIQLEETLAFMFNFVRSHNSPSLEIHSRHCKDLFFLKKAHGQVFY